MRMSVADTDKDTRLWGMILHLSLLLGHFTFLVGLVAPIIIWQIKKNELPGIDQHGKNAANWIISLLIYGAICAGLFITVILAIVAIPLGIVLAVLGVVFPIIAGIKANSGEYWKYPLSITFFK
jgi:uncharacterized Tic20 family protein